MLDFTRYETPAAVHRQLGLVCTGFGCTAHKVGVCAPRKLGSYAAVWIPAGTGWLETEATSQRLSVKSGSLFWLFPRVTHAYAPGEHGWSERWVIFEGPQAERFEQQGLLSPARPLQYFGASPAIDALFMQLYEDFTERDPLLAVLGAAVVYRLIVVAYQRVLEAETASDPQAHQVWQVRKWLDEHACGQQDIDFAGVAAAHRMGYSTLRRRFKQATGYSPKEYVLRVRLSKAKELLAFTQQRVGEIARSVGFRDPYYFSRLFHQREGLSPELFRMQQRGVVLDTSVKR